MKKKILVTNAEMKENGKELILNIKEGFAISELKPMEQMLVDSDNLSFIYITDNGEDYTYISIPETVWPELEKARRLDAAVYLKDENSMLLLAGFQEELTYLIENIKGNSNYGEVMVEKVENTFKIG